MEIKISVRNLIEFVHRYGDIISSSMGSSQSRMEEGTRAHVKIQKERQKEESFFEKERYFKYRVEKENLIFIVDGRADGIVPKSYIEEIKSTYMPLEELTEDYNFLHWAQVMFYGFMHCYEEELQEINLLLTYYNLETEISRTFERVYSIQTLEEFVDRTIEEYLKFVREDLHWKEERNLSLRSLGFPFTQYREGQRDLAVDVYRTLRQGGKLFAK